MVTGAASGIGRATAQEFAKNGGKVIAVDIDDEDLNDTVAQIEAAGGEAQAFTTDISNESQVQNTVEDAIKSYGDIDILCNIAGVWDEGKPLLESSSDLWHKIMEVNVKGTYLCTREVVPHMLENDGGKVINTSSIAGKVAGGGGPIYTSSKHAISGFTKQLALEYAPEIRANAVCPGLIKTEMTVPLFEDEESFEGLVGATPADRYAEPSEIAKSAMFLASDHADFIHGEELFVDGGLTLGPM